MDASQPSFYHITDPLQHLNLEVTLKRVHGGGGEKKKKSGKKKGRDGGGDASDNDDSDDETSSPPLPSPSTITSHLTWQQKLFGPRELALLSPPSTVRESGRSPRSPRSPRTPRTALWKATGAAGGAAGGSACDEDYRAALHQRFFDGSDPLDDLASSMIFTYVDKDSFVPKSSMAPSLATTAAGNDPHLNPLGVARATLPLKQMGRSLLPAASVGMKKHLTRETPFRIMYVMAAVDVDVPSVTKGSLSSDPSLIFGGAATAGGPRFYEKVLCTIKLHGSGTMEATPGFSVEEQEDPDSTTFSTSHDLSTRQSQGSKVTTFRFATPKGTVYEYSVRNLNGAESVVEEERMAGEEAGRDRRRVEESRNRRGSSFFAHPPPKIPFFLHCSTEIVSATGFQDEGGRLFAEYEVTLPSEWTYAARCPGVNWGGREPPDDRAGTGSTQLSTPCYPKGPHGLPRVSDSRSVATSKFVACLGFVTVVVSVLMGEGYAVWMVAAVVIAVAVGGGGPSGQCDGEILKPVYHFSHPFNLHLAAPSNYYIDPVAQSTAPTLLLQLSSKHSFQRHVVEGYGYVKVPTMPGSYDLKVKCWVPRGGLRSEMRNFFIGGAYRLHDLRSIEMPPDMGGAGFLSKFGFRTEKSGTVDIRMNVVTAAQPAKADPDLDATADKTGGGKGSSIEDILSRVRSSRNKESSSKASTSPARRRAGAAAPDLGDEEGGENGDRKGSTSDVLERVRARRAARMNKTVD